MSHFPIPRLLAILAATLIHNSAAAAWSVVQDELLFKQYIDLDSAQRNGKFVRVWSLVDYERPIGPEGAKYNSTKLLFEFDCTDRRLRTLVTRNYSFRMGSGINLSGPDRAESWEHIEPDSEVLAYWKLACKK